MTMIFPRTPAKSCDITEQLLRGVGKQPVEVLKSRDYLVILNNEDEVKKIEPDFNSLKLLNTHGVIVTAQGNEVDFVSRFFAPGEGIPEDPVTGSSHTTLIPYWSERLRKKEMVALQLSKRGGKLYCEDLGDSVKISGQATTYLIGEITV